MGNRNYLLPPALERLRPQCRVILGEKRLSALVAAPAGPPAEGLDSGSREGESAPSVAPAQVTPAMSPEITMARLPEPGVQRAAAFQAAN